MSPFIKSEIVPLHEVPQEDRMDEAAQPPTVLVVDDEPLVADTLSVILERAGFTVMTAYDGASALSLASHLRPQLLISDVAMPDMNGVELAITMKAMLPECKVLLFSGHATSVDLVRAMDAGHDFQLLAKPVHPVEMLRQVTKSLKLPPFVAPKSAHLAEVIEIRQRA